jgi:hypothetical protein
MEAENSSYDRTFNKDIAFLMELQRIEAISNNFAIEGSHDERLRALRRWAGALSGVLFSNEKEHITNLVNKCKPVKTMGKLYYDTDVLDELHDYLNQMNTTHKLQLTTKGSGAEAAKLV